MRLPKLKENEEVRGCKYYLDYINCGDCYVLTKWINWKNVTVTLNKDTILEDLYKKYGGSFYYVKLCSNTFRVYKSMSGEFCERDMDEVINWTKIDHGNRYLSTRLLKTLVTGEGLKEFSMPSCIVRWAKEGNSRGEDWYRLLKD